MEDESAPAPPRAGPRDAAPAPGWAVPGSIEDQPGAPAPAVDGATGGGAASAQIDAGSREPWAVPGEAAVPRLALRPMTTADILDGAFAVVKARPRRILGIAALFVVPTHLLAAYLQRGAMGPYGLADLVTEDPVVLEERAGAGAEALGGLLSLVATGVALVCVAAAVAHLVTQWMMGRDAPGGEMLRVIGRRWWPLLASFVLVKLLEGAPLLVLRGLGILLVPFVMPLFVPVAPIIGVEGSGPFAAMGRSIRLTASRFWRTLGIAVLMGIVASLVSIALGALPQGAGLWIGYERGWPLVALGAIAAEVVVMPFVAAATALLYLDLRVRLEGLDIEMAARRVLDRAR
ncbi:MAG TPA: hypothetical protein VFZ77_15630 [Acidimicrobiales bacterium]